MVLAEQDEYTIPFGRNNYCGPAALAYVMRTDPDTAATLLRDVSGKRKIIGTSYTWMLKALSQVGLQAETVMPVTTISNLRTRLTLRQWLAFGGPRDDQEFIIGVTGHYIVVHGTRYFDSMCHFGKPVSRLTLPIFEQDGQTRLEDQGKGYGTCAQTQAFAGHSSQGHRTTVRRAHRG